MTTQRDKYRLERGAKALQLPVSGGKLKDKKARLEQLWDAVGAMQSLDDLGSSAANKQAMDDMDELMRRAKALQAEIEAEEDREP